jgi:hypothetical protein
VTDWSAILRIPARSAPDAYGPFESLADDLVRFGPEAFGLLARWPTPNGPYVVADLCWAPDVAAARRALLRDAANDRGALARPPEALLPDSRASVYSELKAACEAARHPHGFVFTRTGACVGHYVSIQRFTYLFRSGALDPGESVYAILADTDPDLWTLTVGIDLAALALELRATFDLAAEVGAEGLYAQIELPELQLDLTRSHDRPARRAGTVLVPVGESRNPRDRGDRCGVGPASGFQ